MPEFVRMIQELVATSVASVIDENIHPTQPLKCSGYQRLHLLWIGHIAGDRQALAAHCMDFGNKLFQFAGSAGAHCHICSRLSERQSYAAAYTSSRAGNYCTSS